MREATASRQTGQFAYFAAQAPQRMWPQGTRAVDFSGSKQIGHSSRSGVPGAAAGAGAGQLISIVILVPTVLWRFQGRAGRM